ncbi:hypothetical protein L603_003200000270 [Cellulosimicrobium cellulans J34]|nr:hypothetical protein L603_003200000270 [Cellulosimicrobium cellulans J34]SME88544.1 hypothetical protein SAMN02744115_00015 [Cellulosimicrobium cellulans J1]
MDATVAGLVPDAHAGAHLLALPRSRGAARTPVDALARAWFADAAWTSPPGGGGAARPMAGARFRGVVPDGVVAPGELRLADGARAVGPFPLTPAQTQALDLAAGAAEAFALHVDDPAPRQVPAVADDRDGLARAFAAGLPQGLELQVLGWAVAAARRVGGAVVADGRTVLTPDPASGVDLTLYSAQVLGPDDALGVLRTTVPSARVVAVHPRPDGLAEYVLSGETPYDGAVRLWARRVPQVPLALGALDWREHGPHAYGVTWVPPDPFELEVERPSGLHVIARSRARVLVARLAAMLQGRLAGALVDGGGFVVRDLDLDERLTPAATPTTQFWV